jgi:malonyl-CoA O-methyltransferase
VTGYLVPTLLAYGERELVLRLVRWLICTQRADGSYTSARGVPYVFDTAQVLRGLLAGAELEPRAVDAAQRAADCLCAEMVNGGRGGFGPRYDGDVPDNIHVYALPPLRDAAKAFDKPAYRDAAERCAKYYAGRRDALQMGTLTHFLAYELDGLIDMGYADLAMPVLRQLSQLQRPDGSVRGVGDRPWVCVPGLAQLAVCWYNVGNCESADLALRWLESHQQPSGGFRGSRGRGASYFPDVELPWAAKFYLDAHLLRMASVFSRSPADTPSTVAKDDARLQAVLSVIHPLAQVLEVGCRKGRFSRAVRESSLRADCTAVDAFPRLLARVPAGIRTLEGSPERIPCPDDSFDVVFCAEGIEHSANLRVAVAEMIRVARPGGEVVLVHGRGRADRPAWASPPQAALLRKLLNKGCDGVTQQPASTSGGGSDGTWTVWRAQKRKPLDGSHRHRVLLSGWTREEIVESVRRNRLLEWAQVPLLHTEPGEKILEIASGTGEISLALAQAGRIVTAMDMSDESLTFACRCARDLGVPFRTVCGDATAPLPFEDGEFDCVLSSGLLDCVSPEQRVAVIQECSRVASRCVIALVANASSVAYRIGRAMQEEAGIWRYGLETAIQSLRSEFRAAGLEVTAEYSVGAAHALNFLPHGHPVRSALATWAARMSDAELRDGNQGYLLVTVGSKPGGREQ